MKYKLPENISNIVKRCEVNDVVVSSYNLELDFRQSPNELSEFFNLNESDLPEDTDICILLINTHFTPADMLNIKRSKISVEYELSITFDNETWQSPLALRFFIDQFISDCLQQKLNITVELEETFGFYLKLIHYSTGAGHIKQSVEPLYQKLKQIQSQLLVENSNPNKTF